MSRVRAMPEDVLPEAGADLETVLGAWHEATLRLERTHSALRAEVRRLTDELETKNRELARKDRLADLGQMASHVAHEVRNSLVPVTLYLSLLRRRISADPGSVEVLDKIEAGFASLDATVNDLLQFTSQRDPQWQVVSMREVVDGILVSLAPQFSAQGIHTRIDVGRDPVVVADRGMVRRAVFNLVLNAVDSMPDGGVLEISATGRHDAVEIRVADTGPGISHDAAERMFEPFFTTKCGGTGLGLAIVHRIAEAHQGEVAAANRPAGGAVFTLRIPCRGREAAA